MSQEQQNNSENSEKVLRVKSAKSGGMVFAPGVSGNPAGKPKGTKHITTLFIEALKNKSPKDGKTWEDLFIERILTDTIIKGKGDLIRQAWDHIDGKPSQAIDLTTDGERIDAGADVVEIARRVSEELKAKKTG